MQTKGCTFSIVSVMLRDYHVDKALVCFFDKTWWNEAHRNTFSLSPLFYYHKYNRNHFECEIRWFWVVLGDSVF